MKKIKLIALIFTVLLCEIQAQHYTGVAESHYAGYLGLDINPANVVTPYFKTDINLLTYNLSFVNDYATLRWDSLANGTGDFFDRLSYKNGTNEANLAFNGELTLLGGIVSIGDKMGVGFGIKSRFLLNARGINKDLIRMSASGLEDSTFYGSSYTDDYSYLSAMAWNEYSVAFGAEVFNTGKHYLKVGGALKLLQSVGSFYVHAKDISYAFYNADTILNASGQISFGGNEAMLDMFNGKGMPDFYNQFGGGNFGFAADFGAVYEYRPDSEKEYKLKAGLSFHDIGFVSYKKDLTSSNTITFKNSTFNINMFDGIEDLSEINKIIIQDTSQFNHNQGEENYLMQTPSRMNLFVDYKVVKGFYVSFLSEISLFDRNNPHKIVGINSFELTPRYDFKWFGFSLPISYVQNSGFNLGLGLRVGPVFAGSSNLIDLVRAGNEIDKFNVYFGFRIPLYKSVE
ncbi:DUF5723 family protein [Aureispira anguillae]|uniref:DUF5723 family protein n=1 Tax=Aureispira anguillae TaxID=2864201 RepID=A0A915YGK2_9BACT|nr:DUF5723 family protein [Aureispira anguillae]BDS12652.1 DUF5723 family protein [Aureispira anguillae]